jgi:hypothetical protein
MSELIEPKVVPVAKVEFTPFFNQVPSNWELSAKEDGAIVGYNPVSGERFEGTMENFNKALRG